MFRSFIWECCKSRWSSSLYGLSPQHWIRFLQRMNFHIFWKFFSSNQKPGYWSAAGGPADGEFPWPLSSHTSPKVFSKLGPSDSTWVTTITPFPFKQEVNGTFGNQSAYTQEIHIKVCLYIHAVERQHLEWGFKPNTKRQTYDVATFVDENQVTQKSDYF